MHIPITKSILISDDFQNFLEFQLSFTKYSLKIQDFKKLLPLKHKYLLYHHLQIRNSILTRHAIFYRIAFSQMNKSKSNELLQG